MGYQQLAIALASHAIKWTYTVMPFGPTNGLALFISFIHDIDSKWKAIA